MSCRRKFRPPRRQVAIPCSRQRDVGKSSENAGFARPARDVFFQEGAEFRGFLWRARAAVTDLVKLLRHDRLDEFAHGYVPAAACGEAEGGDDGNALTSRDKADLGI